MTVRVHFILLLALLLAFYFIIFGSCSVNGQVAMPKAPPYINPLKYDFVEGDFPDDLLSTRSLGLVFVDEENKKGTIAESIATLSQPTFSMLGIDVVGWYNCRLVGMSRDTKEAFKRICKVRDIENLVVFYFENDVLDLHIFEVNQDNPFPETTQPAWHAQHTKMDNLMSHLKQSIYDTNMQNQNLLISNYPELFKTVNVSTDKKEMRYAKNMKTDKVAVIIPSVYHPAFKMDSTQVSQIIADYPFEKGVITGKEDAKVLKKNGYRYLLYWVYGVPRRLSKVYNIVPKKEDKRKAFLAQLPKNPQFKVVCQHILTGDLYYGVAWDGAETPEMAFDNFLTGFLSAFK